MDRAWENGIRWFDTADAYGGGRSEPFIGRWRADPQPDGLVLTTKVFHSTVGTPTTPGSRPTGSAASSRASLERLGVERIDLYLAHEPDPETPLGDTIATLRALRDEGLIGAWGLSQLRRAPGSRRRCAHGASGARAERVLAARPRRRGATCCRSATRARDRVRAVRPALRAAG